MGQQLDPKLLIGVCLVVAVVLVVGLGLLAAVAGFASQKKSGCAGDTSASVAPVALNGLVGLPVKAASSDSPDSDSAGSGGSVATVDSIEGIKIPYKNTKLGLEEHLTETKPKHYVGPDSKPLTFAGAGAYAPHTTDQEHWYFNEYWPTGGAGWEKIPHKKLLITSKETGKSVVVSAEEAGPAASVTARDGIGAGAPPEVFAALGLKDKGAAYDKSPKSDKNRITVAFVKDQKGATLGPADGSGGSDSGGDGCAPQNDEDGGEAVSADFIKKIIFRDRRRIKPTALVLHYTAGAPDVNTTISALKSNSACGSGGCSVQMTIDGDGKIYQLMNPLTSQGAHAACINDKAIGIEIGGTGESQLLGNEKQFQAVVAASVTILKKYDIQFEEDAAGKKGLLSHTEVGEKSCSASRKYSKPDPGQRYMEKVRSAVKEQMGSQ